MIDKGDEAPSQQPWFVTIAHASFMLVVVRDPVSLSICKISRQIGFRFQWFMSG